MQGEESFIITDVKQSTDLLIFEGCYWACPYECFVFDYVRKLFWNVSKAYGIVCFDKTILQKGNLILSGTDENNMAKEIAIPEKALILGIEENGKSDFYMLFVKSITVQKESSMRYFKCPPPDKAENEKFKKQHAELLIKEKAFKKKEKILHRIYWILFFVIFCCITIAGTWLVWQIPEPKSILLCAGLYLTRFISILVFYDLRCHHCRPCGFTSRQKDQKHSKKAQKKHTRFGKRVFAHLLWLDRCLCDYKML